MKKSVNPLRELICPGCLKSFSTRRPNKIYCKDKCKTDKWMREHPRVIVTPEEKEQLDKMRTIVNGNTPYKIDETLK